MFGSLTRKDLLDYAEDAVVTPLRGLNTNDSAARDQLLAMEDDRLTSAASWVVNRRMAYEHLMKDETEGRREEFEQAFERGQMRVAIFNRLVKLEIDDRLPTLTAAELEAFYEKHKPEYRRPFQFNMRHLVLLTYKPYVVEPGDEDLESIAERISGDPAMADKIRMDTAQRPLRREPDKQFKPLSPGERLLVPMDEREAEEVRRQLETYLKELDKGVTFEELARKYSDSEHGGAVVGPLPTGTKEILSDFVEQARQTPVDGISPIFRTHHGWQVIQILQKQEEGFVALEEVRGLIENRILREAREKLGSELEEKMFANPLLKVDYEAIRKGDTLTSDTTIATVGDAKLPLSTFGWLWERQGKPQSEEQILFWLKRVKELHEILLLDMARPDLETPGSTLANAVERSRCVSLGEAYLAFQALVQANEELTTGAGRLVYDQRKDELFKATPVVTFLSMERRLTPEQLARGKALDAVRNAYQEMRQMMAELKTPEDFKVMAETVNAGLGGQAPVPPASLTPVLVTELEPDVRTIVERLEPGQWSAPHLFGENRLVSILLLSKEVVGYRPYEEVAQAAQQVALQNLFNRILRETEDAYLQEAGFEPKL
jgi:hypothetical protein